jgi:elongation factor Ts
MAISASMVRELREKTSAGMLDCKKALEETKGDFEAAVEWLRVKGLSSAAKKADRLASEGLVSAYVHNDKVGVLVEVNSETDFVSKNDMFKKFVSDLAQHVASTTNVPSDVNALLDQSFKSGQKIGDVLKEAIAKIGENLVVRRFTRFDGTGVLQSYIHGDGKIGVIVELSTSKMDDNIRNFAKDMCLHIAAMNPLALSTEDVPADVVSKEKEILRAKNLEQGKKAEMIDKIVEGQIRKFLAESCLLEQAFVKNPDQRVKEYMADTGKKAGENFSIKRFARFELGEGLQKRSNNFAEEVAAQSKGAH